MIEQVLYDFEKERVISGFYIYGTEFLPGDHVWVDTKDGQHLQGRIYDIFRWHDNERWIDCVELDLDNGDYIALDDYDIRFMDYVTEQEEMNNE